ncbi:transposase, partial [Pseudaeromonas pectinilytica]
ESHEQGHRAWYAHSAGRQLSPPGGWGSDHPTLDLINKAHALLKNKGIKATIPPRKNAALWEEGHPRNEAVEALKAGELAEWKKQSGYHQRSKAETAMYRYKQLISPKLSLRNHNGQVGEMLAGVKVLNKVIGLGMPG